jgi:phosphoglycolate phosphatase
LNQVITSSYLAALYLQSKLEGQQSAKKVFAIGQSGLIEELSNVGIEVECAQSEHPFDGEKFKAWKPDDKVFAVVAGLDKNMSYLNLSKAICYLQDPRILFIATNTDATYPCGGGRLAPGCGCLVKFLEYAVNRTSIGCTLCCYK